MPAICPRRAITIVLLIAITFPFGCVTNGSSTPSSSGKTITVDRAEYDTLVSEVRRLKKDVKRNNAKKKALEKQVAETQLRELEKEALAKRLQQQQENLQAQFKGAIEEVVSAKSKLRSLESKAEAASNMAETEIALKNIKMEYPGAETDSGIIQASHMLSMSSKEFEKENFGGALYLAVQASSVINSAKGRLVVRKPGALQPGEVPFALPLDLSVIKVSNMRKGPGAQYPVVATLQPNTPVTGFARKGDWVRITDENGLSGWIYQSLVGGR